MTPEQKQVRDWMLAAGQECPEKPTIPSLEVRKLRAKLILEEALETIEGLGVAVYVFDYPAKLSVDCIEDILASGEPNLKAIADGCEDLKVVTEGTLAACGLLDNRVIYEDGIGKIYSTHDLLFEEVMDSNRSKFYTPDQYSSEVESQVNNPNWIPHTVYVDEKQEEIKYVVVKTKDGKVVKGPSYFEPHLGELIEMLKNEN